MDAESGGWWWWRTKSGISTLLSYPLRGQILLPPFDFSQLFIFIYLIFFLPKITFRVLGLISIVGDTWTRAEHVGPILNSITVTGKTIQNILGQSQTYHMIQYQYLDPKNSNPDHNPTKLAYPKSRLKTGFSTFALTLELEGRRRRAVLLSLPLFFFFFLVLILPGIPSLLSV